MTEEHSPRLLSEMRTGFIKAVVPAVAAKYLQQDFAEPVKMIARTSWNIAHELLGLEIKQRKKEKEIANQLAESKLKSQVDEMSRERRRKEDDNTD